MSRRRRAVSHHNNVVELTQALILNGRAIEDGPRKKHWSRHDLKHIKPLTPTQDDMFQDFIAGSNIVAHGSAGTGKSYIAVYLALNEFLKLDSQYDHIVIVRSAVPTREIGFVPGTTEEKLAIYEQPYKDIFGELLGKYSSYDDMKEANVVKFISTSFIRGLTWDNSLIILDEAQSCNWHELNSVLTRVGNNSRIIICGDLKQNDLIHHKNDQSGMATLIDVATRLNMFSVIQFTSHDIVRSHFAKSWIMACEEVGV